MPRPTIDAVGDWQGRTLVGPGGERIGTIRDIYLDYETDQPAWALVMTGLFGSRASFVPLVEADDTGTDVAVPYDKATVKDAPNMEADGQLSPEEETELYRYYGLAGGADAVDTAPSAPAPAPAAAGDAMTRSEEELRIEKRQTATRMRLKKYIVTEYVTKTVPVRREEVRLEREPVGEDQGAGTEQLVGHGARTDVVGADTGAREGEAALLAGEDPVVTLYEEQVVVEKRVVPRERVRIVKDQLVEEQEVGGELRKERIEVEQTDPDSVVDEDEGRRRHTP